MDISYYGPESLTQLLNAYETRFQLLEDLVRLRLRREGLLHGPRRRRQPGRRRRSLLKPQAKRGIMVPAQRPPPEWNTGRVVLRPRRTVGGGHYLPRGRTLLERTRYLLRKSEDGTPPPSAEDIRNRILLEQTRHRPRESEDSHTSEQEGPDSPSPGGPGQGIKERTGFSIRTVTDRVHLYCPFPHRTRPPEVATLSIERPSSQATYPLYCIAASAPLRRTMMRRVMRSRKKSVRGQPHNLMRELLTIVHRTSSVPSEQELRPPTEPLSQSEERCSPDRLSTT